MCGIFGVVGKDSTDGLKSAALTLSHRGPDGFGDWKSPSDAVYLAHCRLAIIDLSDSGRQPMSNEDGSVQITFNGEIYNYQALRQELIGLGHQFKSRTDTEVIVHGYEQWGTECVKYLRGIFAFAIWDDNTKTLIIARDHLGVKPLYYSLHGQTIAFSSEPKAILAIRDYLQRAALPQAVLQYLQLGYVAGKYSVWNRIQRLMPGTIGIYRLKENSFEDRSYWSFTTQCEEISEDEAVDRAECLIDEAVKEQVEADVPVGLFLSGGVDSTLICAKAAKYLPRLTTFCVDFSDWQGSERDDARAVALRFKTNHMEQQLSLRKSPLSCPEAADRFFAIWDEPMANLTTLPIWELSKFARKTVKVALSGDGGDELFRGYNWYRPMQLTLRRRAAFFVESWKRRLGIGREWPYTCANAMEYFQFLHWGTFSRTEIRKLFPDLLRDSQGYDPINDLTKNFESLLSGRRPWQALDLYTFLIDDNLARTDRASMAAGLEVRVPLLDFRLAELAFSIGEREDVSLHETKPVLRRILRSQVSENISEKKKQGFSFPIEQLVNREAMVKSILAGSLISRGVLSKSGFTEMFVANCNQPTQSLWLLFVLESWARKWWFVD